MRLAALSGHRLFPVIVIPLTLSFVKIIFTGKAVPDIVRLHYTSDERRCRSWVLLLTPSFR